jgi:predicted dehydrogenase
MLGYAFMGKAHSRALRALRELDPPLQPELATVGFENGAIGTLEASRLARGRVNSNAWELNGSDGSLAFDVEGTDTVAPRGATFQDGYRCAEVCNAIQRSTASGRKERIDYR